MFLQQRIIFCTMGNPRVQILPYEESTVRFKLIIFDLIFFWTFRYVCNLQLRIAKHQKFQYHIQQWADLASLSWVQLIGKMSHSVPRPLFSTMNSLLSSPLYHKPTNNKTRDKENGRVLIFSLGKERKTLNWQNCDAGGFQQDFSGMLLRRVSG